MIRGKLPRLQRSKPNNGKLTRRSCGSTLKAIVYIGLLSFLTIPQNQLERSLQGSTNDTINVLEADAVRRGERIDSEPGEQRFAPLVSRYSIAADQVGW